MVGQVDRDSLQPPAGKIPGGRRPDAGLREEPVKEGNGDVGGFQGRMASPNGERTESCCNVELFLAQLRSFTVRRG